MRLRPERPYYRWKLSVALAAMGLFEQAVKQMRTAVELAPGDTYYRFQLADIYLLMGDLYAAIDELETVVTAWRRATITIVFASAPRCSAPSGLSKLLAHFERAVELQPANSSHHHASLRYAPGA